MVLNPKEVCPLRDECPFRCIKSPSGLIDCYGALEYRDTIFFCDLEKLKEMNSKKNK
ncbi:MAG: hypothetical protein ACOC56_00120 [Atribacterota bacterium]